MRKLVALALVGLFWSSGALAADEGRQPLTERPKWRFEFDNDIFTGGDDAFSAGFSLQRHSPLFDRWEQKRGGEARKGLSLWIGRHFPGLGDDGAGGRIVRRATGVSFVLQTPEDIENPDPQPNDVPWAGVGGLATSWSSYDNRRLAALQVFVGCMGPCSGAEQVQVFVHDDLGLATARPPVGTTSSTTSSSPTSTTLCATSWPRHPTSATGPAGSPATSRLAVRSAPATTSPSPRSRPSCASAGVSRWVLRPCRIRSGEGS